MKQAAVSRERGRRAGCAAGTAPLPSSVVPRLRWKRPCQAVKKRCCHPNRSIPSPPQAGPGSPRAGRRVGSPTPESRVPPLGGRGERRASRGPAQSQARGYSCSRVTTEAAGQGRSAAWGQGVKEKTDLNTPGRVTSTGGQWAGTCGGTLPCPGPGSAGPADPLGTWQPPRPGNRVIHGRVSSVVVGCAGSPD